MAQATLEHLVDIDPDTGEYIQGWPRIRKSIVTILTTRLRTRIMRRWWGSKFRDMLDKPINKQTLSEGILAIVEAVNLYEPEFKITSVTLDHAAADGSLEMTLTGTDLVESYDRQIKESF